MDDVQTNPQIELIKEQCDLLHDEQTPNLIMILKTIPTIRPNLTKDALLSAIASSGASASLATILRIGSGDLKPKKMEKGNNAQVDAFLGLLAQIYFLDSKAMEEGLTLSFVLVDYLKQANSRKLDAFAQKIFFYFSHFAEQLGQFQEIRPFLLAAQRSATLRHDELTRATVLTLLLRNYLAVNDIGGADKLISKTTFPTTAANAVIARYLYYLGKIRAIQLDYTTASEHLTTAIRKIDASEKSAGFLQAATKLNIIVQLLIGELPERSELRSKYLEKSLRPYMALVNAVRVGDLTAFTQVYSTHAESFKKDGMTTLIGRLRNNVIKTGIRGMSLSYSRIPLKDVCLKLGLESEESAEYIVAKAIRDGVIEANLVHEAGYLESKETLDVYSTDAPSKNFHERIKFCLALHNDSVKVF